MRRCRESDAERRHAGKFLVAGSKEFCLDLCLSRPYGVRKLDSEYDFFTWACAGRVSRGTDAQGGPPRGRPLLANSEYWNVVYCRWDFMGENAAGLKAPAAEWSSY